MNDILDERRTDRGVNLRFSSYQDDNSLLNSSTATAIFLLRYLDQFTMQRGYL